MQNKSMQSGHAEELVRHCHGRAVGFDRRVKNYARESLVHYIILQHGIAR